MGGRIGVDSVLGEGSTFWVELPLEVAGEDDESVERRESVSPERRTFPGVRALIAEDQPAGRHLIKRQMAALEITATIVEDGAQAFAAYSEGTFDVLITDCHMPHVDGFELTRMIRRDERGTARRLPVLALTANALQGEDDACIAAGMDAYVSKPASLGQLAQKIGDLVGERAGVSISGDTASPPQLPAEPAVDLAALGELIGDHDERELRAIVADFLATSGRPLAAAQAALAAADASGLREAAHAGKGSALNVCARVLASAWAAMESAAARGDVAAARAVLPEIEARLADVRAFSATP
jgi:CheY-like chemotaxis protein/HPt (histidine-containing phosphotransfer) domain-containing protein